MPNDNIERAIKKGTGGGETANFEELTYEIYGPHGVAVLVEVSTDNRNRAASEIRSLVTKHGGTIATAGSVKRLFHRKGQIIIAREAANEDQLMEIALEAGAEEVNDLGESFDHALTRPHHPGTSPGRVPDPLSQAAKVGRPHALRQLSTAAQHVSQCPPHTRTVCVYVSGRHTV